MAGNAPHIPGCRDLSLIGERVARSIFAATSDRLGRPVAVTVYPPLSEGRTAQAFDRAAATAQRLGAHPSVLTIHEWGHADDGRPWIVTDPQPAESVDTLLTLDGPLDVERALRVGILLAGALETAHRAGIVHGDLSPSRLVFGSQGEPLLAETGLAEFAVFPGLGALNNPVRYHAPPEVLERTEISPATDVYSLATTVYALLAGRAPQQKPAEITDSNASLLLRILQMPVPPIERPDLPPGLEEALRGPLSPNPPARPQQAIEVAWALQDVQRRAGFAVTEPVVFDLDDLSDERGHGRSAAGRQIDLRRDGAASAAFGASSVPVGAAGAPLAFEAPQGRGSDAFPGRFDAGRADGPGHAPAAFEPPTAFDDSSPAAPAPPVPSAPAFGDPPAFPEPPASFDAPVGDGTQVPGTPSAFDRPSDPAAGADPVAALFAEPFDEPDPPPPTIFPFAEGVETTSDEARSGPGAGAAAEPAPAPPLWPEAGGEPGDAALWPSSWPADRPPEDAPAPTWAAPPDQPVARRGPAAGDDGGSIGDVRPLEGGAPDGPAPSPAFGPVDRPPELDQLPSWYTDPLPNAGATPGGNGLSNGNGSANGNGHGVAAHDAGPGAGLAPTGDGRRAGGEPPLPRRTPGSALPGAGDELRSLFGEVVGDHDDEPAPPGDAPGGHDDAARPLRPDVDPLGPPSSRPPIDLSRLETELGPTPYLPGRESSPGAGGSRTRLPRRHEVTDWQAPAPPADDRPAARLPRAGAPSAEGAGGRERGSGPAGEVRAIRLERAEPRQVAPAPERRAASAGPPALPVIILIGVVAVLILGVAWLVITGDDAEPPASDRPANEQDDAGAGAGAAAGAPTDVQIGAVPEGVQVTWTGDAQGSYVVTVLAPDQPPKALPEIMGSSALVPTVELGGGAPRCFTVATVGEDGTAGSPSAPACTEGADPAAMQMAG